MDTSMVTPVRGTDALHPDGQYNTIAKLFHWITVLLSFITACLVFFRPRASRKGH